MKNSHLDIDTYSRMYDESIRDPETFWSRQAEKFLSWSKKWNQAKPKKFAGGTWFEGGKLNASYNCIDRHVEAGHGKQVAFYFEDNDGETEEISYDKLLLEVSIFANVLKEKGIKKGDRVCIYMPMIPEAIYAVLACARIGAIHSVVFAGFSSEALLTRIDDAKASLLVTADVVKRGNKEVDLLERVEKLLPKVKSLTDVLVVNTTKIELPKNEKFFSYSEAKVKVNKVCEPEKMSASDPLFILYTSGSTGKPKGVLHSTAGYLLYAAITHKYVFDYQDGDVYWCGADIGWITGHTYIVYGPLLNRATSVVFGGVPTHPTPSKYWEVIDKHNVNVFYSTPTAIRMLMGLGDAHVKATSRKSLRILGTVGEPINPEAWRWYHEVVGDSKCHIVDTWWQTETGGIAIVPLPNASTPKPGAALKPFFGIEPVVVDESGKSKEGATEGILLLKGDWPGRLVGLYEDEKRFKETYLNPFPGYYFPGDGVRRDEDGDLWITGRIDDTLNVAGRLVGTAEVESALVLHKDVAEAAVVAIDDELKGSAVYAFVCLKVESKASSELESELKGFVSQEVGSFAKPEAIQIVDGLPKTRSGKIMRRILRKIVNNEEEQIGDTSTLADRDVIEGIISGRVRLKR